VRVRKAFSPALRGKNVVVAEDVVNSSTTSREVVEAALRCGARVTAVLAIWNRGGVRMVPPYEVPIHALIDEELVIYPPGTPCPLCERGVPLRTDLGHGGDPPPGRASQRPLA
jgi:orotate phosphoribosyltransferase